jgi:hypothetical protein
MTTAVSLSGAVGRRGVHAARWIVGGCGLFAAIGICLGLLLAAPLVGAAAADPGLWHAEWPRTDFSRHSVAYREIISGGPPNPSSTLSVDLKWRDRIKSMGWSGAGAGM